jgi:radical SAM protein with 4Fe4S-binding SPASM domain
MTMGKSLKARLVDFYLRESSSFCMMPWVHIHTWPDGRVLPCCLGNPENPLGHLDEGLTGVWNNDAYRRFRQKLLNDVPVPEHCRRCYEFEQSGSRSLRQHANQKFGKYLDEVLEATAPDGEYREFKLRHIDFRFSNLCNLKCRSCCHELSSGWYQDSVALFGDRGAPIVIKPKNQGYLDEVVEVLPYVDSVYFAGGEPLLQEEHYFILDKLKELGRTDVDLTYATNFTTLGTKKWDVLEYWDGFKSVDVMASLDGSGRRGELLRSGQDWNVIVANRKALLAMRPNVTRFTFQVSATVSAMNVFHLPDFHRQWIEEGLVEPDHFLLNLLTSPRHYCSQILPREAKERVEALYRPFMDRYLTAYPEQYGRYEALLAFMWAQDASEHLREFVRWTRRLDQRRGERFTDVFPEWASLFAQYADS